MAQYDGSIRIGTEITTKQAKKELKSFESSIAKTADKIASLRSKMDALKDAKIPTAEYQNLQKEIESTEKKLLSLYDRKERFLETGGKESSPAYQKMIYDAETLEKKLQYAEQAMQNLVNSGKAFTSGKDTEKYAQMSADMQQLSQKMESDTQHQSELQNALASEEQRLADIKARSSVSDQEIINLLERRKELIAQIKDMEAAGVGLGYQEYEKANTELTGIDAKIKEYKNSLSDTPQRFSAMRESAQKAFNAIRGGFSTVGKAGKTIFSSLARTAKNAFSSIGSGAKKSSGALSTFASRLKGIALSLLVFNWITKAFNVMVSGIKNGFSNFSGYSKSFANSIQQMKNAASGLGNQIAAAFAPLVQLVVPWIMTLINAMTRAAVAIGQFIAAITGKKTFTKATKIQEGYADSLGGTAKAAKNANKQLSSLDKLNNLTTNDSGGGGGGGGGAGADFGDIFEESEISSKIKDFADLLKKSWEEADFTEVGGIIGRKLKEALENIPWDGIQGAVNKTAKSLATLLNGVVETGGLANVIGKSIAEAINTGIGALATFAENLHWDSVGKFIADGINGALSNIDWNTALTAAGLLGSGITMMLNNALTPEVFESVGRTIGMGLNTALTFALSFISTFDWLAFGTNIGTGVKTAIQTISWSMLGEAIGGAVQGIIDTFAGFVESKPWEGLGSKIAIAINHAISAINLAEFTASASAFVVGILGEISNAIADTEWSKVASDVVAAIKAVDWMGIASGLFDIGKELIGAILDAFKELPAPVRIAATAIGGFLAVFTAVSAITKFIGIVQGVVSAIGAVVSVLGGPLTIAIGAVITIGALLIANWDTIKDAASKLGAKIKEKWEGIKISISGAWNSIKTSLSNVPTWFKEKFELAVKNIKSAFSGVAGYFKGVRANIKAVFGNISEWFRGKFSAAWTAVKNVFSKGGKIFDGIKDGILNGLKTVVNAIISGINKVIAIPFNGLNSALRKIKSVNIAGITPFSFLPDIKVPQIPRLATGAVIPANKEFLAVLGDQKHGTNIEAPLDTIKQAVREELGRIGNADSSEITIRVPVEIDGRALFEIIKKLDLEQYRRTGHPSFQT